eukprot:gene9474-biopygen2832
MAQGCTVIDGPPCCYVCMAVEPYVVSLAATHVRMAVQPCVVSLAAANVCGVLLLYMRSSKRDVTGLYCHNCWNEFKKAEAEKSVDSAFDTATLRPAPLTIHTAHFQGLILCTSQIALLAL